MKRSTICENFLKNNEVNCCSKKDSEDDGEFNSGSCECCREWGVNTYDCNGYNPTTESVEELGEVCHECLCYFYNGDESEVK